MQDLSLSLSLFQATTILRRGLLWDQIAPSVLSSKLGGTQYSDSSDKTSCRSSTKSFFLQFYEAMEVENYDFFIGVINEIFDFSKSCFQRIFSMICVMANNIAPTGSLSDAQIKSTYVIAS